MLVVSWMSSKLVTVDVEDHFAKALQIMKDYRVSHLPAMEDGKLVGMLSGMTLNDAILAAQAKGLNVKELGQIKVREVMTPNPPSITLCHTVEDAALLMLEKGLTGLPVQDESGNVMAVITASDIMRAMVSLSGGEPRRGAVRDEHTRYRRFHTAGGGPVARGRGQAGQHLYLL